MTRPTDFRESLHRLLVHNSRDWAEDRADAWLYGVIVGWDDEDGDDPDDAAMSDVASRHGWDDSEVERLRLLHRQFIEPCYRPGTNPGGER